MPLQFSTELSSSGGIYYKRILLFLLKIVRKLIFRDLSALFYLKMAVQGGLITPGFGGGLGSIVHGNEPYLDWIMLALDAGCLLFILYGSS